MYLNELKEKFLHKECPNEQMNTEKKELVKKKSLGKNFYDLEKESSDHLDKFKVEVVKMNLNSSIEY